MSKEGDKLSEAVILAEPFLRLKEKFQQKSMPVSVLMEKAGISKISTFYWASKDLSIKRERYIRSRMWQQNTLRKRWRMFSIEDAIAFALLKYLRSISMPLALCQKVRDWFYENLFDKSYLISKLSEGDPLMVLTNGPDIQCFSLTEEQSSLSQFLSSNKPGIFVPLYPPFRSILEKIERKDFQIEFVKDRFEKSNKAVYRIDGKEIKLERP